MRRHIFFLTAPLRKPRTGWGCQPVALRSPLREAPVGLRSSASIFAVLDPRRAAPGALVRPLGFLAGFAAVVAVRPRRLLPRGLGAASSVLFSLAGFSDAFIFVLLCRQ